ncbi:hypothetical protein [Myxococcus phage Mx1]|nr:hypothetical protein [Myxococcus phage Mx1]
MAVHRQGNWLGQQRVDVSDLRAIESSIVADFDVLAGRILAGRRPLVIRGFTIASGNAAGNAAEQLQLSVAGGLLLHFGARESGTLFAVSDDAVAEPLASTNTKVIGAFTASAINYVGIDFERIEAASTSDLKQFLDADTEEEVAKTVPTARILSYKIIISTQPFSVSTNICPIAKIETSATNTVVAITDSRNLMFRLGSGGDTPNPISSFPWPNRQENDNTYEPPVSGADPFSGGDKSIASLKQWMDAVMSRIWETGSGQYWYSATTRDNVKVCYGQPVLPSTGDNFAWNSGTDTLTWSGLSLVFENSPVYANAIADGSAVLDTDGQCLYVDLQRDTVATLQPNVTLLSSLGSPTLPGSRFVLAWRSNGIIQVRDKPYEVGRPTSVATTIVSGIVRLSRAASNPSDPVVLTSTEKNSSSGVAALDASKNVIGAGLTRDTTLASGIVSVGTGTNDNAVSIGRSATTTTVNGTLAGAANASIASTISSTAGDMVVSSANNYKYATAVTDYATITADDLMLTRTTAFEPDFVSNQNYSVIYDGFSGSARARIPSGATITSISILMENNNAVNRTFGDMGVYVKTYSASGAYTTSSNIIATGSVRPTDVAPGTVWKNLTLASTSLAVPLGGYLYVKVANDFPSGSARSLGFRAMRIGYTYTQVKPTT